MNNNQLPKCEDELNEFKESINCLKEGIISFAAMLNKYQKANLYIGIKDDLTIVGVNFNEKIQFTIQDNFKNFLDPYLNPKIEVVNIDEKNIIHIYVDNARKTLYTAYEQYKIRSGPRNVNLTRDEIEDLVLSGSLKTWDSILTDEKIENIDFNSWEILKNKIPELKNSNLAINENLSKLELQKNGFFNNAGLYILGTNAKIPVTFVVFSGNDKTNIVLMKDFSVNIIYGIEEIGKILLTEIIKSTYFEHSERKEEYKIPEIAIREILINSFIHRDYKSNEENHIFIFKDRIEFYNPGAFNEYFEPADYLNDQTAQSKSRNPIIMNALKYAKYDEKLGTGLKRAYDFCTGNGNKIIFTKEKRGFSVSIYFDNTSKQKNNASDLSQKEISIIEYVKNVKTTTISEISNKLQIQYRTTQRYINKLTSKKLLKKIGETNNTVITLYNELK